MTKRDRERHLTAKERITCWKKYRLVVAMWAAVVVATREENVEKGKTDVPFTVS